MGYISKRICFISRIRLFDVEKNFNIKTSILYKKKKKKKGEKYIADIINFREIRYTTTSLFMSKNEYSDSKISMPKVRFISPIRYFD